MQDMVQELAKIFMHMVLPALAGVTFFALAKFVKQITPLRSLVSSEQAYKYAFWGFLTFGFYLILRPVQVLAGPHPWPLIFSCVREFLLIGIFGPTCFISILTLCLGPEKVNRVWISTTFLLGLILGVVFCVGSIKAIGGSEEIVKFGMLTAYDGLWFKSGHGNSEQWMKILFYIRLFNPGLLLLLAATVVLIHALFYPKGKKQIYDNMPKKLFILSAAVYVYAISLTGGSFIYGLKRVPDQWGLYHIGTLLAGLLETISLSMPVRKDVQVSEHE